MPGTYQISGELEVETFRHRDATLVCREDARLILPPIERASLMMFKLVTIGSAKVTIEVADGKALISSGYGEPTERLVVGGHQVYQVLSQQHWCVFGACGVEEATLPEPTPVVKSASPRKRSKAKQVKGTATVSETEG